MKSKLRAVGLRKSYHGKTVVDGVSLEIQGGEIVGLLGPNGAGKTTTFSMILGLVPQDSGRVFLDDEDICRCTCGPAKASAFCPRSPALSAS
jgi:lipopolysaccharide export system ATP-binding protein